MCSVPGTVALLLAIMLQRQQLALAGTAERTPTARHSLRLDSTNLLLYRDGAGDIADIKTRPEWLSRRAEIINGLLSITGVAPTNRSARVPALTVLKDTDCGSYVRRFVSYAAEAGCEVPAYLLIPKHAFSSTQKIPAVLALHPTDMKFGHRVVVEPLRSAYPPYAADLAELGFVVLAPAYPLMANYQPDLRTLGYKSGTMKAIQDNRRGLDLLESLPFVRRGRFGVIGHSLGGHNAIFTAVFDTRIVAVVTSCGFDSFRDYMDGNIAGWTSERYMPALSKYRDRLSDVPVDFSELLGALAPRSVFISAPYSDANFKWMSVDRMVAAARPVYALYGNTATNHLIVEHPKAGHEFPPDVRKRAYAFLQKAVAEDQFRGED